MAEYNLLNKSEIIIIDIFLEGANLTDVAACVADIIGVDREDVLVIDVRDGCVALDVLRSHVDPQHFVGRKSELLENLSMIPGVNINEKTDITSHGMLGWIAMDDGVGGAEMRKVLNQVQVMELSILEAIQKRVIVFSSGIEVETGQIEDTNTPMIMEYLSNHGFKTKKGPTLKDDETLFAGVLRETLSQGYGAIITTGGVGAEDKDHSVEAVLRLDPQAIAPYIVKFEQGKGRHYKDGIRIAVGQKDGCYLITLPGPNDEVMACLEPLRRGLKSRISKEEFASELAAILRERLRQKMGYHIENILKPGEEKCLKLSENKN